MYLRASHPLLMCETFLLPPPPPSAPSPGAGFIQALIKRVIAVGGDTVQIKDGSLFINGQEQFEDYTFEVRFISHVFLFFQHDGAGCGYGRGRPSLFISHLRLLVLPHTARPMMRLLTLMLLCCVACHSMVGV